MRGYGIVGLIAAVVTAAFVPLAIRIAWRFNVVDHPDTQRRLHSDTTPLMGGVAMCIGFVAALFAASRMQQFREMFVASSETTGIAVAAVIITIVGLVDDRRPMTAPAKLAGMVLAGSALYLFGTTLDAISIPFSSTTVQISADLAPLVTVLWVVGMANAINLVDGLDGLAAGIVMIASGAFLIYSTSLTDAQLITGSNVGPLIAALTCGVCIGFLPFNFNPARLFMGDAGALLLGLLLAASTMVVGGRAVPNVPVRGQTYFFFAPLVIPLVILIIPIGDILRLVLTRAIGRSGVASASRDHLHYRLVELGHGPRRTVFILCALTAIFSAYALAPLFFDGWGARLFLISLFLLVVLFTVLHPDLRHRRRRVEEPAIVADRQ
jgi:UDP-GlcNAc:undecaprenyl-phosphate/decaprenyl-phosphate GlcNAc-1-phosphate transferase